MKDATALRIADSLERIAAALEAKGTGEVCTPPTGESPKPPAPACSKCDDKGYTGICETIPQWCTCPRGAQYQAEGKKAVYKDGRVE